MLVSLQLGETLPDPSEFASLFMVTGFLQTFWKVMDGKAVAEDLVAASY